ncbi:hypothetical protein ISN45_Aa05g011660 [Arabidopsis thaliana x Arabidopsis arenosa]|uniref:Uncharacterized protein n=1 Tax=Arabidopsis thaliana x Arabidopsis arenosa TaxID=1240361 RepID=A0A8T1ZLJ6_9BRAS|nr:hypothetical protein ISN45_Aa05g011660 [Arabidopsis thaliana x Arabidopsis arenosa]
MVLRYKLVISVSETRKIASHTIKNIQLIQYWEPQLLISKRSGSRADGDSNQLPGIAVVATYDTFGAACGSRADGDSNQLPGIALVATYDTFGADPQLRRISHLSLVLSIEMQFFYEEHLHRMECRTQEAVLFEDILCQIFDMIKPEIENCISLQDLKASKLSESVFNILFNLKKFMVFETRDLFLIHQARIFEGKEPPQLVALFNIWWSLRMTEKGSSDETYTMESIALIQASGTGGENNELNAVSAFSEIVPDTVVFDDFERFPPTATTVSSALLLGICGLPDTIFCNAVDMALADSLAFSISKVQAIVNVGGDLIKLVRGRVSTEVDARLAYDTNGIIRKGIEAARLLESEGIQTYMTFVYNFCSSCSRLLSFRFSSVASGPWNL